MDNQLVASNSPQQNFPLWKRGIKGDFLHAAKSLAILKISPSPSFSKRGIPEAGARRRSRSAISNLLLLVLLLFSPRLLFAQEPLRAGTIFSATQAPLWAAKEGRYFEKYGIKNLEVIQFSGGQPVTRALIGGDIQISTTGGAAVVNARLKGADTVIIARTVGVFPYTLYVGKGIRDAGELKGKKLAVSTIGGSGYVAMQYALNKSAWIRTKMSPCCRSATLARAWHRSSLERFKEHCCFRRSLCGRASSDFVRSTI